MKTPKMTNTEFKRLLQEQHQAPPMSDAGEFWAKFRARAELAPQPEPAPIARGWMATAWPRWALAGATVTALLFLMLTLELPLRRGTNGEGLQALSKVDQVDVFVDYASMMIVEDNENGGTLVWLAGIETEADNSGG